VGMIDWDFQVDSTARLDPQRRRGAVPG
jgi:hypothetical protein